MNKIYQWVRRFFRRTKPLPPTVTHTYPEPDVPRKPRIKKVRRRYPPPDCHPGTITYQDQLVRWCGYDRRAADRYLRDWRENQARLPTLKRDPLTDDFLEVMESMP